MLKPGWDRRFSSCSSFSERLYLALEKVWNRSYLYGFSRRWFRNIFCLAVGILAISRPKKAILLPASVSLWLYLVIRANDLLSLESRSVLRRKYHVVGSVPIDLVNVSESLSALRRAPGFLVNSLPLYFVSNVV